MDIEHNGYRALVWQEFQLKTRLFEVMVGMADKMGSF